MIVHDPLPMRFLTEGDAQKYILACERYGFGVDPYRSGAVFPYEAQKSGRGSRLTHSKEWKEAPFEISFVVPDGQKYQGFLNTKKVVTRTAAIPKSPTSGKP